MKRYAARQLGPWATFGILTLISLVAWGMGSPELALVMTLGAMGALFCALSDRLPVRRIVSRLWHLG